RQVVPPTTLVPVYRGRETRQVLVKEEVTRELRIGDRHGHVPGCRNEKEEKAPAHPGNVARDPPLLPRRQKTCDGQGRKDGSEQTLGQHTPGGCGEHPCIGRGAGLSGSVTLEE